MTHPFNISHLPLKIASWHATLTFPIVSHWSSCIVSHWSGPVLRRLPNRFLDWCVQFVAFALYLTPLLFMVEKLVGVHEKKFIWRIPVRLPIGQFSILLLNDCNANFESTSKEFDWQLVYSEWAYHAFKAITRGWSIWTIPHYMNDLH